MNPHLYQIRKEQNVSVPNHFLLADIISIFELICLIIIELYTTYCRLYKLFSVYVVLQLVLV